jgi:transcriptional regulator with XRE-family HTH domain
MDCRSHVDPLELGLPYTSRRRVTGLRRAEVAELVGVSVDWYRSFESGRAVRVSPQFIDRLSKALCLCRSDRFALFRLALPEIYHLDISESQTQMKQTQIVA